MASKWAYNGWKDARSLLGAVNCIQYWWLLRTWILSSRLNFIHSLKWPCVHSWRKVPNCGRQLWIRGAEAPTGSMPGFEEWRVANCECRIKFSLNPQHEHMKDDEDWLRPKRDSCRLKLEWMKFGWGIQTLLSSYWQQNSVPPWFFLFEKNIVSFMTAVSLVWCPVIKRKDKITPDTRLCKNEIVLNCYRTNSARPRHWPWRLWRGNDRNKFSTGPIEYCDNSSNHVIMRPPGPMLIHPRPILQQQGHHNISRARTSWCRFVLRCCRSNRLWLFESNWCWMSSRSPASWSSWEGGSGSWGVSKSPP